MVLDLTQFDGHTPGEWQQNGREIVGAEGTPRGRTIALLALNTTSGGPPFNYLDSKVSEKDRNTVTANGRLLSAAPALLAEVRALRAEVERMRKDTALVVADYDLACREKYDELCWDRFCGVDLLRPKTGATT